MGRDPRPQFAHPEGLGQVVISPNAQPLQHGCLIGPGRQEQNGCIRLLPDPAADSKAAFVWHHHIQQDAVRPAAECFGQVCPGAACHHPVAIPLQGRLEQDAQVRVIVHRQNVCHTITSSHCKAGRTPHTKDRYGPDRTSKTAACARCPACRCRVPSVPLPPRRTTRNNP